MRLEYSQTVYRLVHGVSLQVDVVLGDLAITECVIVKVGFRFKASHIANVKFNANTVRFLNELVTPSK